MEEIKRFIKTVWHITLSSLTTLLVYFPLAFVLKAAQNDRIEDGSFFWAPVIIFTVTELAFLVILWWVRFHNNDDLEKDFMKEYRDIPWQGKKADLPGALKSEALVYVFVYAVTVISCGITMLSAGRNPLAVLYFPLTLMQSAMHPVLGCAVSLVLFTAGYTLTVCFVREKLATTAMRRPQNGSYNTRAYIQSRRYNRK